MKFYPMHLHLHCSHEPTASIGSHMSYASALGVFHIWTTEHDTRMGKKAKDIPVFSLAQKNLIATLDNGATAGFQEDKNNTGAYDFEETEKCVAVRILAGKDERQGLLFYSNKKLHCDPLFARISVLLNADIQTYCKQDGRVIVEFILSAQPPTYQQAKLCYVMGELPNPKPNVQYLPFPKKKNGAYRFDLAKDASEEIGGVDNALCNIRLLVENGAEMRFDSFAFERELNFQQVREEQIKLAKKLSKKWGVTAFVGFEITGAGNHKNCYSTKVPVIDYRKFDYKVTSDQAIAHVKEHGGVFSWNHPFTADAKRSLPREALIAEVAQRLVDSRVYGASLIEVGFPFGRDGFDVKDYLKLWDILSANGVFITGVGASDNHHAVANGWTEKNNFCAFVGLKDNEKPTEENFVKALCRGSVWSGNPVEIRDFTFESNGLSQGGIAVGEQTVVEFKAQNVASNGYAVCVVNGERIQRIEIEQGMVQGNFMLSRTQKYNFARVEIYDEQDFLIALSNPIYLVGCEEDVPLESTNRKGIRTNENIRNTTWPNVTKIISPRQCATACW